MPTTDDAPRPDDVILVWVVDADEGHWYFEHWRDAANCIHDELADDERSDAHGVHVVTCRMKKGELDALPEY